MLVILLAAAVVATAAEPARAPVLIELFTSEGCSSCPPADRLLAQLDSRAIVLSEHVDYWDHEGWKDPYSSAQATQRQEHYGRQFGIDGVYTPEMVVDGAVEFNGSDARRAAAELDKAGTRKKASVKIARTAGGIDVTIEDAPRSASVYLALAENAASSQVSGGENRGRKLDHVAVVRTLKKIGAVKRGEGFHKVLELAAADSSRRVIVFLQDSDLGQISGVGYSPAP